MTLPDAAARAPQRAPGGATVLPRSLGTLQRAAAATRLGAGAGGGPPPGPPGVRPEEAASPGRPGARPAVAACWATGRRRGRHDRGLGFGLLGRRRVDGDRHRRAAALVAGRVELRSRGRGACRAGAHRPASTSCRRPPPTARDVRPPAVTVTVDASSGPVDAVPDSRPRAEPIVTAGASRSSPGRELVAAGERAGVRAGGGSARRSSSTTVESYSHVGAVEDRQLDHVLARRHRDLERVPLRRAVVARPVRLLRRERERVRRAR